MVTIVILFFILTRTHSTAFFWDLGTLHSIRRNLKIHQPVHKSVQIDLCPYLILKMFYMA